MEDPEHGAHYGFMSGVGVVDKTAPKTAVFVSRLLWTMAETHRVLGIPGCSAQARRCARFLLEHLLDRTHGGLRWSVTHDGRPLDERKHVYAQTFGIYGMAALTRAADDPEVRSAALSLFRTTQIRLRDADAIAYREDCDAAWNPARQQRTWLFFRRTSARTSGAYLHLIMSFSELLAATADREVREALRALVTTFLDRMIGPDGHSYVTLDSRFQPTSTALSCGHDLEASWALDRAADLLGDPDLSARSRAVASGLLRAALGKSQQSDGGWIDKFAVDGAPDSWRVWWTQTEAILALLNEAARSPEAATEMIERAEKTWDFLERCMIDRSGGDWFERVDAQGRPDRTRPKVDAWKEPYHQVRCCLRLIQQAAA